MKYLFLCLVLLFAKSALTQPGLVSKDQLQARLKSCLAELYTAQVQFQNQNQKFAAVEKEIKPDLIPVCSGFKVKTNYATTTEFYITAKAQDQLWSIDNLKMIRQID